MPRLKSRDDLVALISDACDIAFSSTTNPTTTQVVRYLNDSLQAFYAMLMECYGDGYFTRAISLLTTPESGSTSLPADFAKLSRVYWRRDASHAQPIRLGSVDELGQVGLLPQAWTDPAYRLAGRSFQWLPVPAAQYTVDVVYVAIPGDLTSGADTVDVGPGWDAWVVADAAARVFRRLRDRESEVSQLGARADAEKRIRDQAAGRNEAESGGIRDTRYGARRGGPSEVLRNAVGGVGLLGLVGLYDHGNLAGLADDDHPQYLLRSEYTPGSSGDLTYVHTQSVASATWTVVHNLGKFPSVSVVDSAGDACLGDVHYDSANQVTLRFSAAFAGKAYFN